MAAILLSTGLVYEVPATRDQVNTALAAGPKADTTVNGVGVSFRTASVMAVADTVDGLRSLYLTPVSPGG
jgi:hypothetical protein